MDINGKVEGLRLGASAAVITVYGVALTEWVAILTIVYLSVQLVVLWPKFRNTVKPWIQTHFYCIRDRVKWFKSLFKHGE